MGPSSASSAQSTGVLFAVKTGLKLSRRGCAAVGRIPGRTCCSGARAQKYPGGDRQTTWRRRRAENKGQRHVPYASVFKREKHQTWAVSLGQITVGAGAARLLLPGQRQTRSLPQNVILGLGEGAARSSLPAAFPRARSLPAAWYPAPASPAGFEVFFTAGGCGDARACLTLLSPEHKFSRGRSKQAAALDARRPPETPPTSRVVSRRRACFSPSPPPRASRAATGRAGCASAVPAGGTQFAESLQELVTGWEMARSRP